GSQSPSQAHHGQKPCLLIRMVVASAFTDNTSLPATRLLPHAVSMVYSHACPIFGRLYGDTFHRTWMLPFWSSVVDMVLSYTRCTKPVTSARGVWTGRMSRYGRRDTWVLPVWRKGM